MLIKSLQHAYRFTFLRIIFLVISLNGCVDLSGSRSTYTKEDVRALTKKANSSLYAGEVHTMLGGLGMFSRGMNTLKDSVIARYEIPAYGTIWYNAGHVSRFITKNYYQQNHPKPIILVGHSLGANEQIKVARNLNEAGVPVALLITVDAVSQTIIPPNVKVALNFYKPGYVPMLSGLKLRAVNPQKTRVENINVSTLPGVDVNHFTIDKNPIVQELILKRIRKVIAYDKRTT